MLVENMRKHLNIIVENSQPQPAVDQQTISYGAQALQQLLAKAEDAAQKLANQGSTSQNPPSNTTNDKVEEGFGTAVKGAVGAIVAAISMGAAAQGAHSVNINANPKVAMNLAMCAAYYDSASKAFAGSPDAVALSQLATVSYQLGMQNKSRAVFNSVFKDASERAARTAQNAPGYYAKNFIGQKIQFCNSVLEELAPHIK